MNEQPRRLDSWKEIADYLGRDVRTAMRWAKSQQLPVRRVGGRGRSVFAFTNEIDAWLAGNPSAAAPEPALPEPGPLPEPPVAPPRGRRIFYVGGVVVAAAVLMAAVLGRFWRTGPVTDLEPRIEANERALIVRPLDGEPRQLFRFDPDLPPVMAAVPPRFHDADGDGTRDVMAGVAYYVDPRQGGPQSGELINVSREGVLRWRFTFNDVLTFRLERFDGPWGLIDWSIGPSASPARIAAVAHHHTWWPSLAVVLDHTGRRLTTFVHPGWLESVMWIDGGRVAAAGFTNARDAAMLAVIDAGGPDTHAPPSADAMFQCASCTHATPMFYAAFPRSEVNVASASRFNRARVSRQNERIVVRTVEFEGDHVAATAIYEFDKDLELVRAQYDDPYWTLHARLEREGRITHTREACPARDGPPGIDVWRAAKGWTRVTNNSVARLQYR